MRTLHCLIDYACACMCSYVRLYMLLVYQARSWTYQCRKGLETDRWVIDALGTLPTAIPIGCNAAVSVLSHHNVRVCTKHLTSTPVQLVNVCCLFTVYLTFLCAAGVLAVLQEILMLAQIQFIIYFMKIYKINV